MTSMKKANDWGADQRGTDTPPVVKGKIVVSSLGAGGVPVSARLAGAAEQDPEEGADDR